MNFLTACALAWLAVSAAPAELAYSTTSVTQATGAANCKSLNAYFDGGYLLTNLPLEPQAAAFVSSGTINMGERTGMVLRGRGGVEPIWHSEADYAKDKHGGSVSRIIDVTPDKSGATIRTGGYANEIAIACQGALAEPLSTIARDDGPYPLQLDEACRADHAGDVRRAEAVRIDSARGFGSGKHRFPEGFAPMLYQTGIHVTDDPAITDPSGEHGDQCQVMGRFAPFFTDVGFWCEQLQAFSWRFDGEVEQGFCSCAFLFDRGAKLYCAELSAGTRAQYGLYIRGADDSIGPGEFTIDKVNIDETAPCPGDANWKGAGYQELVVRPPEGKANAAPTFINFCHIPERRALVQGPLATIVRSYALHYFGPHRAAYDGAILVQGGNERYFPTIILDRWGFYPGSHDKEKPWRVFAVGSSGKVQIRFRDCYEFTASGPATNSGRFYRDETLVGRLSTTDARNTPSDPTDDVLAFDAE